ncbi:MAG: DUF4340 domain-containing protein [Gammaproteobacteria bacterium]|nr:DUF4340 domain-containing protein [Gammaproteobacteria bacterium]
MNNRLLLNLLLLIGVLALIAVVVYKPGIEPPQEIPPLTTLAREQVAKIEIVRAEGGVTLERAKSGWQIAGTVPLAADTTQIDALLALLDTRPERSYAANTLDLAKLKLSPAQSSVRFDTTEIRFGDTDPLQGLRYVQLGDRVHLIMDSYQNILQGKRTQFASRKLLPDGAEIVALELPKLKLSKQDKGWTVKPAPEKLSADAPNKLVQAWGTASALWVREYQKADSQPVTITLADGQKIVFELRSGDGERVLARPDLGVQYQLPEDMAKPLLEIAQPVEESQIQDTPSPKADSH